MTATATAFEASTSTPTARAMATGRAALWTARITAGLGVSFLTMDTVMKLLFLAPAVEGTAELGFPPGALLWIALAELACLVLYLVPRTAVIGAILWTGYLGGAIATHVRLENPLFSHTLFPLYVAVLLWLPLWLRDPRVRVLVGQRPRA